MKKFIFALATLMGVGMTAGSASALVSVGADVTTDTVWTLANSPYVLEQPIFVKNGATLTIEAGVIVRGQPRTDVVTIGSSAGTPGALIITQDGYGIFDGSASAPIVLTTAAVDNDANGVADDLDGNGFLDAYPGFDPADCPGACSNAGLGLFLDATPNTAPLAPLNSAGGENIVLWGGMVILGNAPTNVGGANPGSGGYNTSLVEGLTVPGFPPADATYGGLEANDSSGVFRYLSVRHAGDEIGDSNELNGITLAGVGAGTIFENIEVYCNFDDGIEWFGGTVNGKNLAVFFAGDDQFDLDQGYTGTNQYLFTVPPFFAEVGGGAYGSKGGEKLGEWDGDDAAEGPGRVNIMIQDDGLDGQAVAWPQSDAQMYNITAIGNLLAGGVQFTPADAPPAPVIGLHLRDGFAGGVLNSVVINTVGQAILVDNDAGQGFPDSETQAANDRIRLVSSTLYNTGAPSNNGTIDAIANGDAAVPAMYNGSGTANVVNSGNFALVNDDITFNPQGTGNTGKCNGNEKGSKLDPRIDTGASDAGAIAGGVTTGLEAGGSQFRGAFSNTDPLWTTGWTALSQCGVLP